MAKRLIHHIKCHNLDNKPKNNMKKDYAIGRLARIFVACLCLFLVSPSSFAQDKDGKEDGDKD